MCAIIKDFEDLVTKYYNNEISLDKYCELVNKRIYTINNKPNIKDITTINKIILGNI